MLRRLTSLLMIAALATAPVVSSAREGNSGSFANLGKFLAVVKNVTRRAPVAKVVETNRAEDRAAVIEGRRSLRAGGAWAVHKIGHMSETLLLLWTLAAIEGVLHERHLAPLRDQSTGWLDVVKRAGSNLVNDPGLYFSMAGSAAVGYAGAMPLGAMTTEIMRTVPNETLGRLMASGAGSFVTFVGWEAGSRLWDEAIYNMSILEPGETRTKEQQAQVEKDIVTGRGLRILDVMRGAGTADENRVFGRVMQNALELLVFTHPERTTNWLSNTFRLNILTGEFVTVVTMMTAAGTAATAATGWVAGMMTGAAAGVVAGPVGSVIAGIIGGIAGGLGAHFVPERQKQRLTDGIRKEFVELNRKRLNQNSIRIEEARTVFNYHGKKTSDHWANELHEAMIARSTIRNNLGTWLFTQIYDAATKYQEADLTLTTIPQVLAKTNDPARRDEIEALQKEFTKKHIKSRGRAEKFLNQLLAFYDSEAAFYRTWLDAHDQLPAKVRAEILSQRAEVLNTREMLTYVYAGVFPDRREQLQLYDVSESAIPQLSAGSNILLNQFNLQGYQEKQLVEATAGGAEAPAS